MHIVILRKRSEVIDIMNKKLLLRIAGIVAVTILVGNCVGCRQSPEKGNNASNGIEVETIEVETIEVEENVVYWPD